MAHAGRQALPAEERLFGRDVPKLIRKWIAAGYAPEAGTLSAQDSIITICSCFARELRQCLGDLGCSFGGFRAPYRVTSTFSILDFIAWCVTGEEIGRGYRYDRMEDDEIREWTPEAEREEYLRGMREAGAFVFGFGVSEVWQDRETGVVFGQRIASVRRAPGVHRRARDERRTGIEAAHGWHGASPSTRLAVSGFVSPGALEQLAHRGPRSSVPVAFGSARDVRWTGWEAGDRWRGGTTVGRRRLGVGAQRTEATALASERAGSRPLVGSVAGRWSVATKSATWSSIVRVAANGGGLARELEGSHGLVSHGVVVATASAQNGGPRDFVAGTTPGVSDPFYFAPKATDSAPNRRINRHPDVIADPAGGAGRPRPTDAAAGSSPGLDLARLASQVYDLIDRKYRIERIRRGL